MLFQHWDVLGVTRIVDYRSAFPYFRESPPEHSFGFPLCIQWLIFSEFLWCFANHEEKLRRALVVDFPNLPYCCDHFRKVGRSSSLSLSISVLYCMSRGAQDRPLTPPSIKMRPEHLLVGNH